MVGRENLDKQRVCQDAIIESLSNLFLATSQQHGTQRSLQASGALDLSTNTNPAPPSASFQARPWLTAAVVEWDYSNGFKDFKSYLASSGT